MSTPHRQPSLFNTRFLALHLSICIQATRSIRKSIRNLQSSVAPAGSAAVLSPSAPSPSHNHKDAVSSDKKEGVETIKKIDSKTAPSNARLDTVARINGEGRDSNLVKFKLSLMVKLIDAERWMTRCGFMMLVLTILTCLLGTNIQFKGPTMMALFVVGPIADQVTSFFLMQVLSVSIEKVGTSVTKQASASTKIFSSWTRKK